MSMSLRVKHGTVTEMPAFNDEGHIESCMIFDNLHFNHNNAKSNAVYFTDSESVCDFFAEEKYVSNETQAKTIINSILSPKKPFEMDKNPMDVMEFDGNKYDWPEQRNLFYKELKNQGYDVVIIDAGYTTGNGEVSSDIAVLDPSIVKTIGVKLKLEGRWTQYLDKDELRNALTNIAIKAESGDLINNDELSDYSENTDVFDHSGFRVR